MNIWWIARGALAVHATFAIIAWTELPARIPVHFDINGNADGWAETSMVSWFIIVGASAVMQLVLQLLLSPAAKNVWNIPEKERFLRLSTEQQKPVIKLMQAYGGFSALCVTLMLLSLNIGMFLTAKGYTQGLPWYVQVAVFAPIALILIGLIPLTCKTKRMILAISTGDSV